MSLENPFRQPILPPEQTDPEANAVLADTLLGKEYGDALRSLDGESDTKSHAPKQDDFLDMTLNEEELEVVNQSGVEKERESILKKLGAELEALKQSSMIIGLESDKKMRIFFKIASAEAKIGLFDQAKKTADGIKDDSDRLQAFSNISIAETKAGLDPTETLVRMRKIAGNTQGPFSRAQAFNDIAIAEARSGLNPVESFIQAKKEAKRAINGFDQRALSDISIAEAQIGLFDQAKETMDKILKIFDGGFYADTALRTFINIAAIEAQAGFLDDMQKLSEKDQIPVRLAIIEVKIKKAKETKTKQS